MISTSYSSAILKVSFQITGVGAGFVERQVEKQVGIEQASLLLPAVRPSVATAICRSREPWREDKRGVPVAGTGSQ